MAAWKWISGKGFHDRLEGSRISGFFCFLLQEINKKRFRAGLEADPFDLILHFTECCGSDEPPTPGPSGPVVG